MTENHAKMSFFGHLEELRRRLLRIVLAVCVGFSICFYFREYVYEFVSGPILSLLPGGSLIFTSPVDPFFMYLKVSAIGGIFLVIPYVLYEIWGFVAPGLYKKERRLAVPFVVIATALFYTGAAFAYFVVFPVVFKFFLAFMRPDLQPMLSVKEYVSLVMKLALGFAIVFEMPIAIVFLGLLGVVELDTLRKGRRYFVVIAFVVAMVFTPPDVVSQIMMALPLLVLYEASIRALAIITRGREKEDAADEDDVNAEPES